MSECPVCHGYGVTDFDAAGDPIPEAICVCCDGRGRVSFSVTPRGGLDGLLRRIVQSPACGGDVKTAPIVEALDLLYVRHYVKLCGGKP